jgi:hypothetical protein
VSWPAQSSSLTCRSNLTIEVGVAGVAPHDHLVVPGAKWARDALFHAITCAAFKAGRSVRDAKLNAVVTGNERLRRYLEARLVSSVVCQCEAALGTNAFNLAGPDLLVPDIDIRVVLTQVEA